MFDSRGLPDYPPPRNAWEFPPPSVSPRWKWVAIAAAILGLVAGGALFTIAFTIGSTGIPGSIDDTRLLSVIQQECELMTSTVESMPVTGSPRRQAKAIADQNHAIDVMLAGIRDEGQAVIDADPPTNQWLADWERLIAARETYAAQILDGASPDLAIPKDEHGREIYRRMDHVWLGRSSCSVPGVLLDPNAGDESDV